MSGPMLKTRARASGPSRRELAIFAFFIGLSALSCQGSDSPRALIVVSAKGGADGAEGADAELYSKLEAFSKQHGRMARKLSVEDSGDAIELAARGEADVALVKETASIEAFLAAEHGRDMGFCTLGAHRFRVLSVSTKQHPKVDAQGEALASFLAGSSK